MNLTQQETEQFYMLWYALVWGVNEKYNIVPKFKEPVYSQKVNEEPFIDHKIKQKNT